LFSPLEEGVLFGDFFTRTKFELYQALSLFVGIIILFSVSYLQECGHSVRGLVTSRNIVFRWAIYFAFIFAIILLMPQGAQGGPFIYELF
jgi:hypothetical protein